MRAYKSIYVAIATLSLSSMTISKVGAQQFASTPDYATNILLNDTLGASLSREAKQIIGRPFSPDLVVTTPEDLRLRAFLNAPLVVDATNFKSFAIVVPKQQPCASTDKSWVKQFIERQNTIAQNSAFALQAKRWSDIHLFRERLMLTNPSLADIMVSQLPGRLTGDQIATQGYQGELAQTSVVQIPVEDVKIIGEQVERKYWWHKFEGSIHFAQNQVSPNWHKGGYNSFNSNTRVYYNATYEKDRVKWVNEIEYRLGLFTNVPEAGEKMQLKIGEDFFRANSNLGIKAIKDWYYTADVQLRSQLLRNTKEDGTVITQPFAPMVLDAGLGMKYDIDRKEFRDNPFARFRFSANIAPVAVNLVYTYSDNIDKGRIGFLEDQKFRARLGSSIHLNLNWDFSTSLNWTSRLFYSTSYKHIELEFDNSINYAFNRFFTARFSLNTRFDDSVILPAGVPMNFKNLLQYNQLFSLGFTYKI